MAHHDRIRHSQAIVHHEFGPPGEVLKTEPRDIPDPGKDEVLVRVLLRPIHPGDIASIIGPGVGPTAGPHVPGLEGMGVVTRCGDHIDPALEGERIAFFPVDGAWSDFLVIPAALCVRVPDGVPDDLASLALINSIAVRLLMTEVDAAWKGEPAPFVQTAAGSAVGNC